MPCDTRRRENQTLTQRKEEVREAIAKLVAALASGRARVVIGPTGGIAFQGWTEEDRGRVSDVCAYRMILSTGSASAKAAIARAEMLSGRSVSREAVAQGVHTHGDGVWHAHKG